MEVLDNIPVKLDPGEVLKRLRLGDKSEHIENSVQQIIEIVRPIVRPKAIYEVSYVDSKNEDSLDVGGTRFTSRVLRVNLDKIERVFPYIATCGSEVDEITIPSEHLMENFYLDTIKGMVLGSAISYLKDYLTRNYALGQVTHMNPGSLDDWPVTQQKELFSIFGNVEDCIGVKLTESYLMIPLKSVSGIYFPTQIKFESCQLCPREECSGRRAPYDPSLAGRYRERMLD